MNHLGVKLDAKESPFRIDKRGYGRILTVGQDAPAFRRRVHFIAMAHPDAHRFAARQAMKEVGIIVNH